MLDDMLKQVRAAEEEARKIAARGNKEAERILKKVEQLKDVETAEAVEEVRKIMAQVEKIKLDEARATAAAIGEEGMREVEEIKESVKPRVKQVREEIKEIIAKG